MPDDPKDIHERDQGDAAVRELAHRVSAYYRYLKEEGAMTDDEMWALVCEFHDECIRGQPDEPWRDI